MVATLYRALPAGSYVFIHHMLDSEDPASATLQAAMQKGLGRTQFRTFAQIRELFDGLELVEPGVVLVPDWRPDPGTPGVLPPVLKLAADRRRPQNVNPGCPVLQSRFVTWRPPFCRLRVTGGGLLL